ncbi:uncharacterized protein C16orf46 homolog [Mixophyes fleayi]|uniref:uncharacterized protein C16orf46 homolog n=1 Tax=Mixophyes fleayi TaxID=3061075 RepID=UPI003F4DEE39
MAIQDNDLQLENLQELEKFPQKSCSADEGKREKDLTDALAEISEKVIEDDQKSTEWLIRTGWEEAVCGWGPVSAAACLHPQKKPKKLKQGGSTDCVLCLDINFLPESKDETPETKSTSHTNHKEKSMTKHSPADNIVPPTEDDLDSRFTDHCPSTAMVSKTQSYCVKDSSAEMSIREQRQNKERNSQRSLSQFTGALPICTNCYNTKESLMFGSPVLLPPLKASPGNGHTEQLARRRAFLVQQLEKFPSGQVNNNIDPRAERRLLEAVSELPQEQLRVPESLSYIPSCIPRTPLGSSERLQWQCSFLAQKSNSANTNSVKQSNNPVSVGFLHTRTMQNKRNVQQDVRPLNDAKGRRAKSGTVPLHRNTVLPSLTIKRVEIPERIKLC